MALQQARGALTTPVLLLIHDVKAPAILDLLSLGAADFISQPVCVESLRVRLVRLARRGARAPRRRGEVASMNIPPTIWAGMQRRRAPGIRHIRPAHHAPGSTRPKVPADIVEHALSSFTRTDAGARRARSMFRAAKAQVVNGFEREVYPPRASSRHGGNVAHRAARACAKHRRAFWALMRKHGIEAAPYRQAALASAQMDDLG